MVQGEVPPKKSWGGLPTIEKTWKNNYYTWKEWIVVDFFEKKNAGKENTLKLLMFFFETEMQIHRNSGGKISTLDTNFAQLYLKKTFAKRQPLTVDEASIQRVCFQTTDPPSPTWSFGSNVQTLPMHRPIIGFSLRRAPRLDKGAI